MFSRQNSSSNHDVQNINFMAYCCVSRYLRFMLWLFRSFYKRNRVAIIKCRMVPPNMYIYFFMLCSPFEWPPCQKQCVVNLFFFFVCSPANNQINMQKRERTNGEAANGLTIATYAKLQFCHLCVHWFSRHLCGRFCSNWRSWNIKMA